MKISLPVPKPPGDARGWYLAQLCLALQALKRHPLEIIETGTFDGASGDARDGNGWSTWYLAEFVRQNGGNFVSVDNRAEITSNALARLESDGIWPDERIRICTGDSRRYLNDRPDAIDFAYLDSIDGPTNLAEFLLARSLVRLPALIVIDDCHNCDEFARWPLNGYNKGACSTEFADIAGIPHRALGRMEVFGFGVELHG